MFEDFFNVGSGDCFKPCFDVSFRIMQVLIPLHFIFSMVLQRVNFVSGMEKDLL